MNRKKILLGMSGGIDSTYSVVALRNAGFEVVGAVLKMSASTDTGHVQEVADEMGVTLHIIDCTKRFHDVVIADFLHEYAAARTPNPCVICNRYVKIATLMETAKSLDIPYIATGHYADVLQDENTGRYYVKMAKDRRKDQSYMLWRLTQEELSMMILPLAEREKSDIKTEAKEIDLPSASAKESQEICFIPTNDHIGYIENAIGTFPHGNFVDTDGNVVGEHKGIIYYTVGQRKGLGLSLGKPAFVTKIDSVENTVTVSDEEAIFTTRLTCNTLNFQKLVPGDYEGIRAYGKVRYSAKPMAATATIHGDTSEVIFDSPVRAITPGQSFVFYDDDDILFGGLIC